MTHGRSYNIKSPNKNTIQIISEIYQTLPHHLGSFKDFWVAEWVGVSLEDVSFYITHIIKPGAYLFGYTRSLEILLQVGPVLMENLKQLEAVAPSLAKLPYSWPGDRSFGQQPRSPSVFTLHPGPAPTSMLPHRLLDKYVGQALRAACALIAKEGAKRGREEGREDFKMRMAYSKDFP